MLIKHRMSTVDDNIVLGVNMLIYCSFKHAGLVLEKVIEIIDF